MSLLMAVPASRAQQVVPSALVGADGGGLAPVNDPYPGGYVVQAPSVPAGEPTFVTVREGRLQGIQSGSVRYFRGVPFAAPPVGSLRFRPPQPAAAWQGDRLAIANPPASIQASFLAEAPTNEDCLYLNVWAPTSPGPHPVFVYIHGGGNNSGYSLEHRVQGASFARDGIVCVNVGYRVGALGFLELSGLLGREFHGSANNGLRDQLFALQWVQQNIAVFGGDPRRVTIGGQSAGGFNVCSLTSSPLSRGLFNAAISKSGSGHGISTMVDAQAVATKFASALSDMGDRIEDWQSIPVARLLEAQQQAMTGGQNNGVIDGQLLLEHPYAAMRMGRNRDVRLLMGANRDEMSVLGGPPDPVKFSVAQKIAFEKYQQLNVGVSASALLGQFASDQTFGAPTRIYANNHAAAGGVSYVYRWNWGAPSGKFKGQAIHGIEMPFVWDNIASLAFRYVEPDPALQARADTVHRLWVSFIKSGVPTAPGMVAWPPWKSDEHNYLAIGDTFQIKRVTQAEMRLWQELQDS